MKSIRARLTLALLMAAGLTAVFIGTITYRHTLAENEALFDHQLRQIALSLRDQGVVANPVGADRNDPLEVVVQIWDRNGDMLYLSRPGDPLFTQATLGFTDVDAGRRRWRVFSLAAHVRVIQVALPLELRGDLAAAAALHSLSPLLAFAPLMALLIWWLVGAALAPLRALAQDVAKRDVRSLERLGTTGLPDEIAPLAQALNDLLARLEHAFAQQRAFVADAAHELRSPLTALKLQLQVLTRAPDTAAQTEALARLDAGVERASHLIAQMLLAAQTDPADNVARLTEINCAEIVRLAIAELAMFAMSRDIDLSFEGPERLMLTGDAERLRILARNLVDNALRYAPQGGTVRVTLVGKPDAAVLTVDDSGAGLSETDRTRVFDRFYRGTGSEQSGSGLGLAIVKNIVDQHSGRIELGRAELGGLRVAIYLPSLTKFSGL